MCDLSPYLGRWVALVHGHVVGVGRTAASARHMAKQNRPKEEPNLLYVSPEVQVLRAVESYPMVRTVLEMARERNTVAWLVGGSIRDLLLGAETHDLDFAVQGDGLALAQYVADRLRGAYVALDRERRTGRVVLAAGHTHNPTESTLYLDFASLRGDDLGADLRDRDFTVNAMAVAQSAGGELQFIDPLGGSDDLANRTLRAASPTSFSHDPLRTLRAVRLCAQIEATIEPQTRMWLEAAVPSVATVSAERMRDEWFRILDQPSAARALRELHGFGLLRLIAPPVADLDGLPQSPPHRYDALTHTFNTVQAVERLWDTFRGHVREPDAVLEQALRPFYSDLTARYASPICDERTHLALLKCAALLHDVGKPETHAVEPDGRIRAIGHERAGGQIAAEMAHRWRCSNAEADMLRTTVRAHMRPAWLAEVPSLTRRAIHRYYRDTGEYGVDAAFVALADHLATQGDDPPDDSWQRLVETVGALWTAFWRQREAVIEPPPLLSGSDLLRMGLQPGPQIGDLLSRVREAQAAGEITTRDQALAQVEGWLAGREGI